LFKYLKDNKIILSSYADVGCGSGEIIRLLGIKAEFLQVSNFEGIWIHMLKIN
jgi:hypothetical protein